MRARVISEETCIAYILKAIFFMVLGKSFENSRRNIEQYLRSRPEHRELSPRVSRGVRVSRTLHERFGSSRRWANVATVASRAFSQDESYSFPREVLLRKTLRRSDWCSQCGWRKSGGWSALLDILADSSRCSLREFQRDRDIYPRAPRASRALDTLEFGALNSFKELSRASKSPYSQEFEEYQEKKKNTEGIESSRYCRYHR